MRQSMLSRGVWCLGRFQSWWSPSLSRRPPPRQPGPQGSSFPVCSTVEAGLSRLVWTRVKLALGPQRRPADLSTAGCSARGEPHLTDVDHLTRRCGGSQQKGGGQREAAGRPRQRVKEKRVLFSLREWTGLGEVSSGGSVSWGPFRRYAPPPLFSVF